MPQIKALFTFPTFSPPQRPFFPSLAHLPLSLPSQQQIHIHTHLFIHPLTTLKSVVPSHTYINSTSSSPSPHILEDEPHPHPFNAHPPDPAEPVTSTSQSVSHVGYVPPGEVIVRCSVSVVGFDLQVDRVQVVVDREKTNAARLQQDDSEGDCIMSRECEEEPDYHSWLTRLAGLGKRKMRGRRIFH